MSSKITDFTRWTNPSFTSPESELGALAAARALETVSPDELLAAVPVLLPALLHWQNVTGGSPAIDEVLGLFARAPDSFQSATNAWLASFELEARRNLSRDLGRVIPWLHEPPGPWPSEEPEPLVIEPTISLRHRELVQHLFDELGANAEMTREVWQTTIRERLPPAALDPVRGTGEHLRKQLEARCGQLYGHIHELGRSPFLHGAAESDDDILRRFGSHWLSDPALELRGLVVHRHRIVVEHVGDPATEIGIDELPPDVGDMALGDELGLLDPHETLLLLHAMTQALRPTNL